MKKNNVIYIPLGNDCSVAHYLRKNDLRRFALPFDWNITPIHSVIKLIDNDFFDFLKIDNLIFGEPCKRMLFEENEVLKIKKDIITPVICKKYKMLFPHDFSEKGIKDLEKVQIKYRSRIERFNDILLNSKHEIKFIICKNSLNSWQQLKYDENNIVYTNKNLKSDFIDLINKKYPNVNFTVDYFTFFKIKHEFLKFFK